MKLALKILSYTLGTLTFIGLLTSADGGFLDVATLFGFLIVEAQIILTLIYIHNK